MITRELFGLYLLASFTPEMEREMEIEMHRKTEHNSGAYC